MPVRGCGAIPPLSILQQMATQAYSKTPAPNVGELQLVAATPTLKFYKHPSENTIVVAIRGTEPSDAQDVKADASIAIGQLQSSQRFQQDLAALQRFQALNSPSQFDYYGVGHSLGGAILDLFLKMGLLKQGVSYNPAIQPTDFQGVLPNKRIYDAGDPLYKLMGQHAAVKPEVRQTRKKSWWERAVEKVPYVGKAYDLYRSHQLDNFVGGQIPAKKPLSGEGYGTTAYLKEARRRAKAHGYDPSKLELADDGVHKLQITTPEGKVVKFGRKGYGDHLIWSEKEAKGEVPRGTAEKKRSTFRKSHLAMKGQWRDDKYSPNWLAIRILW